MSEKSLGYLKKERVNFDCRIALKEIVDAMPSRDLDTNEDCYVVKHKLEQSLRYIKMALSELDDEEEFKLSNTISNFGGNFHTLLRKGFDDTADCVLYRAIDDYGTMWKLFLKMLGKIEINPKYKDHHIIDLLPITCRAMKIHVRRNHFYGQSEFEAAWEFFLLRYELEDIKERWNAWYEKEN